MKSVLLIILLLCAAACTPAVFPKGQSVLINNVNPAELVERYKSSLPETLNSLNSVVFDYAGIKFLGLGFIEIDRKNESFRVVCLNPMGVKLFDLSGDKIGTVTNFAIEPMAKQGDIAALVAADIRRIYFNSVLEKYVELRHGEHELLFGGGTPSGYLEHIYSGINGDLAEKRFYKDQFISWQVSYHDYRSIDGKRFPHGIVLTNYRDGYQLVIREKERDLEKDKESD
ncbi:MAG: DUF3261 domain-containing protein [Geobacteraceae bacterium]|nr:DUF3261 domain-containing protein [Geobacteraceae bacterium]